MKVKRIFSIFFLISVLSAYNIFAAENKTPAPYEDDEFPQALKDVRRFEIIALGSMPFVTLDVNIAYSLGKPVFDCMKSGNWSTYQFQNPLTASESYSADEIKGVIWTSIGISVGIALTDYIINLVRRNKEKKLSAYQNDTINIHNITEDPEALKLDNPYEDFEENLIENEDKADENISSEVEDLSEKEETEEN